MLRKFENKLCKNCENIKKLRQLCKNILENI